MSEKRFEVIDNSFSMWIVDTTLKEDKHEGAIYTAYDMCRKLNELNEENEQLKKAEKINVEYAEQILEENKKLRIAKNDLRIENEQLRQMIKGNVFERYREGSLVDLEFKAIAYDDIVKVEMSNELEPRVIVYCKQNKKENVMSFCQMFIPFGVAYEIKEVINDE